MTIEQIHARPTVYSPVRKENGVDLTSITPVHESALRSWHVVAKVVELLEGGCPPKIVLELISEMTAPLEQAQEGR